MNVGGWKERTQKLAELMPLDLSRRSAWRCMPCRTHARYGGIALHQRGLGCPGRPSSHMTLRDIGEHRVLSSIDRFSAWRIQETRQDTLDVYRKRNINHSEKKGKNFSESNEYLTIKIDPYRGNTIEGSTDA